MAAYRLLIKASAAKEIEGLGTKQDRARIIERIRLLGAEPRPPGCEKLVGPSTLYRVRQGQFRVIYTVDDDSHTVEIIKVGHRREVYRRR